MNATEPLRLAHSLTVYTVAELRTRLLTYLAEAEHPVLDLGPVGECDCAGVQLLWSARRAAEGTGRRLQLHDCPEPVLAAAERLGFARAAFLAGAAEAQP